MKCADDSKLEGVTNHEDRGLIQMDIKKLEKSQWWQKKNPKKQKTSKTYKNICQKNFNLKKNNIKELQMEKRL